VHRNAGDIARFAEWLRFGNPASKFEQETDEVRLLTPDSLDNEKLLEADQVICGYNKTRTTFNRRIRSSMGLTEEIQKGERLMFLRNDNGACVFNGLQGQVTSVWREGDKTFIDLLGDSRSFNGLSVRRIKENEQANTKTRKSKDANEKRHPVDYAYCITAHKAQGDEWDHVLVVEQKCELWEHSRWAYTAASRAKTKLSWVLAP